jgi:hypothetical protein
MAQQGKTEIEIEPTSDELALFDDISALAQSLWKKTLEIGGLTTDPKMLSAALFKRLRSNHMGYTLLWKSYFRLESDIVLRSALEAAICLSAIVKLKEEFVVRMRQDAASTVQGQIKSHRDDGNSEGVRDGEDVLRMLQKGLPEGVKAARLDWKQLAKEGNVPNLYTWHRQMSGISSHVTGISIIDAFGGEGLDDKHDELGKLNRKMHLMMMAGATLHGAARHAEMINDLGELENALALIDRMNALSWDWPGVAQPDTGEGAVTSV